MCVYHRQSIEHLILPLSQVSAAQVPHGLHGITWTHTCHGNSTRRRGRGHCQISCLGFAPYKSSPPMTHWARMGHWRGLHWVLGWRCVTFLHNSLLMIPSFRTTWSIHHLSSEHTRTCPT